MKERLKNRLRDLCGLNGVSGHEENVVKYIVDAISPYADEVVVDSFGNIIASKKGKKAGKRLALVAHSDEIGYCVKAITEDGYILIDKLGTQSDKVNESRKVIINDNIIGVLGSKPGHFQTPEETKTIKTIRQAYVDIGVSSKKEVQDLGIEIGNPITFKSEYIEMANPDMICSKAIDNRVNCAILIELFKELENVEVDGEIYACFSVQEELGLNGSVMIGNRLLPDYAIVLDTAIAGDTPDTPKGLMDVKLGNGPCLPTSDGHMAFPAFTMANKKVLEYVKKQAKDAEVNLQMVSLAGDGYITDGGKLHAAGHGIPLVVLGVARRYSHSPVELCNINDAIGSFKILKGIVLNNGTLNLNFI